MNKQPAVDLIFPTPVVVVPPQPSFNQARMVELCYQELEADQLGEQRSNQNGWQSKKDLFDRPEMADLTRPVADSIVAGLNALPLIEKRIRVETLWVNISPPGAWNWEHVHPGSQWAGVFYVKSEGERSGKICFVEDQYRQTEIENYDEGYRNQNLLWPVWKYDPQPGCAILFPSTLKHRVDPNGGDSDRISISFNLNFIYDSASY